MTHPPEPPPVESCSRCGAALADVTGRYCTNCGAPRDEAVPAAPPPLVDRPATAPAPSRRRRAGVALGWVVAVVVVLALVAALVLVFVGQDDADSGRADDPVSSSVSTSAGPTSESAEPTGETTEPAETVPTFSGSPEDLAAVTTATAPRADGDSVDISTGRPTTYDAGNMLDGDPGTAWRVEGRATGLTLTFRFDAPVTLTAVGLVNGYAKTAVDGRGREFNLYSGSRRVKAVEWRLDGGDPIPMDLRRTRDLQLLDLGAVQASTVELTLTEVSNVGGGRAARDTTAISEVGLRGYPGS